MQANRFTDGQGFTTLAVQAVHQFDRLAVLAHLLEGRHEGYAVAARQLSQVVIHPFAGGRPWLVAQKKQPFRAAEDAPCPVPFPVALKAQALGLVQAVAGARGCLGLFGERPRALLNLAVLA